jgi:hypothetical protein
MAAAAARKHVKSTDGLRSCSPDDSQRNEHRKSVACRPVVLGVDAVKVGDMYCESRCFLFPGWSHNFDGLWCDQITHRTPHFAFQSARFIVHVPKFLFAR